MDPYLETPRYLKAITESNLPRYDWGPKKAINRFGPYAHLAPAKIDDHLVVNGTSFPIDPPISDIPANKF